MLSNPTLPFACRRQLKPRSASTSLRHGLFPICRELALLDGKSTGQPSKLNDTQRQAIAGMIESGPIPAVHGVVRWRLIDLAQWIFEEFRITIAKQTLSRSFRGPYFQGLQLGIPGTRPRPPRRPGPRRPRSRRKARRSPHIERLQAGPSEL